MVFTRFKVFMKLFKYTTCVILFSSMSYVQMAFADFDGSPYQLVFSQHGEQHEVNQYNEYGWGAGYGFATSTAFDNFSACDNAAKALIQLTDKSGKSIIKDAKVSKLNGIYRYVRTDTTFDNHALIAYCIPKN